MTVTYGKNAVTIIVVITQVLEAYSLALESRTGGPGLTFPYLARL